MLKNLSISNFLLIDNLEIEFTSGLCVLTGETGSGKSILVDAIGLMVGMRGGAEYIQTGFEPVSYTHLTLPTKAWCRSRWSPYH